MNKLPSYEEELPEGYREVMTVDARNKKTAVIFTLLSFLPLLIALPLAILLLTPRAIFDAVERISLLQTYLLLLLFLLSTFLYVILHELTHGVVYYGMTRHRLTFGLTLTVAYCGVHDLYVYRKTALCALLAPFLLFLPLFLCGALFLPSPLLKLGSALLLALHIGGCVGDLYDTGLYLFRFRDARTLMRDSGPTQVFYLPKE